MRRSGWAVLGAAASPIALLGLLGAEWKLAKRGPQLTSDGFPEDGRVGGDGPALRVVWLGDSMVTGAGASTRDACLPRLVAAALDRPVDVVVRAVSGSRVRGVAEEQAPVVEALAPDAVVVCVGTNDVLYRTPVAEVREGYRRLLAALPAGVPVVAVGPGDLGAATRLMQPLRAAIGAVGRRTAAAVRGAAHEAGATYVDLIGATGAALRRDPDRLLAIDRFHLSDDGYRLVAEPIAAGLRQAVARSSPEEVARVDR